MKSGSGIGRRFLAAFIVALAGVARAGATDFIVYTEEYPPYNFATEDGGVAGLSTDRVRQVLDAAGLSYSIQLVPWARAMRNIANDDNAFIFSITRTPGREAGFDWLVPLAPSNYYLFVRTDETRPVTEENLKAGMFLAACVSGDLACEMVRWTGVPEDRIVAIGNNITSDFRMVIAGRADVYISDLSANANLRRQEGYADNLTRPAMRLGGKAGFYLAAGLNVPADVRNRVRAAYEALLATGNYEMIGDQAPAH
ncbi:MAG: transporter substrate-binding domain-containing protein [Alphaproteobacteria bacterium]|nr:MAG: transporter substrate-binding domain-containing protein [Alphaproteobacteria bacterium]